LKIAGSSPVPTTSCEAGFYVVGPALARTDDDPVPPGYLVCRTNPGLRLRLNTVSRMDRIVPLRLGNGPHGVSGGE